MSTELLVGRRGSETWAALREDGRIVELHVDPADDRAGVGRIYKARVSRVLPGIQSAFMEFGAERQAFLHARDLLLPGEPPRPVAARALLHHSPGADGTDDDPAIGPGRGYGAGAGCDDRAGVDLPPIEDRLKVGRDLLVQISRESLGEKGPRATCYLSFPGHLLVLFPQLRHRGVSRRIEDPDERARLLEILARIAGDDVGFVARTAALGAGESSLVADAHDLLATWSSVEERFEVARAPSVVHREPDLLLRMLRDTAPYAPERIIVDTLARRDRVLEYLTRVQPVLKSRVELHEGREPLLEAYGVIREAEKAVRPKVWLKSGGYLVIQETEALVSIDVNTGKFVGGRRAEETVLQTNIEAAHEIARQLRLRNLGGIVVMDFIDMELAESRDRLMAELLEALRPDRTKTNVIGLGELGLVQLTRKRTRPGLRAMLTVPCPHCFGDGRVRSPETVAAEAVAEVRRLSAESGNAPLAVKVHPGNATATREALDGLGGLDVHLHEEPGLRPDRFQVWVREP